MSTINRGDSSPSLNSWDSSGGLSVFKRDGKREPVAFDKITARIKKLCYGFNPKPVDPVVVAQKVVAGVYDGGTTGQLDDLAAETAAYLTTQHPDYGKLAARIAVSNLHKQTEKSFLETMLKMHAHVDPKTGENAPPQFVPGGLDCARTVGVMCECSTPTRCIWKVRSRLDLENL